MWLFSHRRVLTPVALLCGDCFHVPGLGESRL